MVWSYMFQNKCYLTTMILFVLPLYTWRLFCSSYKQKKNKYEEKLLFHKRHNCVVMYNPMKGMYGWPPNTTRIKPDIHHGLDVLCEPIIYFIDTANITINIAVMLIYNKAIIEALGRAVNRGVKIRLIINFENQGGDEQMDNLKKTGIEVCPYIAHEKNLSSIMHYKYMVKDLTEDAGYACVGSLNFSNNGFLNNFEDLVFLSDYSLVELLNANFEECWKYVKNAI